MDVFVRDLATECEMSPSLKHWPRWGLIRSLLVALFFCRGLVYLGVFPIFEGWDEYQHVGYVVHVLETGQSPRPPLEP
jgi:hypothetical protein